MFTPQNITTEDDFISFLHTTFPLFTDDDISRVLLHYPSTNAPVGTSVPEFATIGNSTATALNESIFGTGQQQRADVRKSQFLKLPLTYLPANILAERLRRNNLRLPRILARRSLHKRQPRSIQIPILRRRGISRIRSEFHFRSSNPQSRARFEQSLHDHLGQFRDTKQPLNLPFNSKWCKRDGQRTGRHDVSGMEFTPSATAQSESDRRTGVLEHQLQCAGAENHAV